MDGGLRSGILDTIYRLVVFGFALLHRCGDFLCNSMLLVILSYDAIENGEEKIILRNNYCIVFDNFHCLRGFCSHRIIL